MSIKLLDLDGKDLDKALENIVKSEPLDRKFWTVKETEILLKLHGKVPNKQIAKVLGRSVHSINGKCREI